jgi:hypothetical protein
MEHLNSLEIAIFIDLMLIGILWFITAITSYLGGEVWRDNHPEWGRNIKQQQHIGFTAIDYRKK